MVFTTALIGYIAVILTLTKLSKAADSLEIFEEAPNDSMFLLRREELHAHNEPRLDHLAYNLPSEMVNYD